MDFFDEKVMPKLLRSLSFLTTVLKKTPIHALKPKVKKTNLLPSYETALTKLAAEIRNEAIGLKAGTLAIVTAVLWGGNPVAIKVGLDGMPPAAMAGLRFALGALTVWVGALFAGIRLRVPPQRMEGAERLGTAVRAANMAFERGHSIHHG